MESLMNKRCLFTNSLSYFSSLENFILNLTFKSSNSNSMYYQIRVLTNYWSDSSNELQSETYLYFDNGAVGQWNPAESRWNYWGPAYIDIVGGDDVDSEWALNTMYMLTPYIMYPPNNSKESLDNKVIEFNPVLTPFPSSIANDYIYGSANGEFKIRYTYNGEECITTGNCISFPPEDAVYNRAITFFGTSSVIVEYKYNISSWGIYGTDECITDVVFEDFNYTGLENNETFMNWLTKNAKLSPKYNKDKKIKLPNRLYGTTLNMISTTNSRLAFDYTGNSDCQGVINGKYNITGVSIYDNTIDFDIFYRVYIGETGDGGALPGDYMCVASFQPDKVIFVMDNGYTTTWNYPVSIENFFCPTLDRVPEVIEYFISNSTITDIKNAIIKFKPTLSDWALPPPEGFSLIKYGINTLVSYTLNGEPRSYIAEDIVAEYHENAPCITIRCAGDGDLNICYDYDDARWHHIDGEYIENVTLSYFNSSELNENPDFINWVYANAEDVCFAKGINSTEDLLTNVSKAIQYQKGYAHKINAQDIVTEIVNLSPREVVEEWDGTVVIK